MFDKSKIKVVVSKTDYLKCQRCWRFVESVGKNNQWLDLCDRCIDVMEKLIRDNKIYLDGDTWKRAEKW